MVGTGAIVAGIALVLVVAVVLKRLSGSDSTDENKTRTIEDTVNPTERFERVHATLTFPDGREESIEYDDQVSTNTDGLTAFVTYTEDCFSISRSNRRNNYPNIDKSVPTENKRYINLDNVRDLDIDRTEELVAVAEVEVEKEQETHRDDWRTTRYRYSHYDTEYEFDIWLGYEWDAHES